MRIGQYIPSTTTTRSRATEATHSSGGCDSLSDTLSGGFTNHDDMQWFMREAKASIITDRRPVHDEATERLRVFGGVAASLLVVTGAAALGAQAGWHQGILPGIVGGGIAGVALARVGADLGKAVGGKGSNAEVGTGIAGMSLGVAAGTGLISALTGIHLDPGVAAGVLGTTGALLAFRACYPRD